MSKQRELGSSVEATRPLISAYRARQTMCTVKCRDDTDETGGQWPSGPAAKRAMKIGKKWL